MPYTFLIVEVADRVATVTVNRPDKLNALNGVVIDELGRAFAELAERPDVGAVLLTGAGRAFVAGADIAALAQASADELEALSAHGQAVFSSIEGCRKPVVAVVNGFALGGGCELALACHLRLASESAKFGLPEVKLGLIPGYGGTQRLPRLVGPGQALRLTLSGEMIDAAEALRIGLADAVYPALALTDAARGLAKSMAANAPLALARAIEAVREGRDRPLADALALEARLFGALGRTQDMREGTAAFLDKRPAQFTGQ